MTWAPPTGAPVVPRPHAVLMGDTEGGSIMQVVMNPSADGHELIEVMAPLNAISRLPITWSCTMVSHAQAYEAFGEARRNRS